MNETNIDEAEVINSVKNLRPKGRGFFLSNKIHDFFEGDFYVVGYRGTQTPDVDPGKQSPVNQSEGKSGEGDSGNCADDDLEALVFVEKRKRSKETIHVLANQYELYQFLAGKYKEHTSRTRLWQHVIIPGLIAIGLVVALAGAVFTMDESEKTVPMVLPLVAAAVAYFFGSSLGKAGE